MRVIKNTNNIIRRFNSYNEYKKARLSNGQIFFIKDKNTKNYTLFMKMKDEIYPIIGDTVMPKLIHYTLDIDENSEVKLPKKISGPIVEIGFVLDNNDSKNKSDDKIVIDDNIEYKIVNDQKIKILTQPLTSKKLFIMYQAFSKTTNELNLIESISRV